MHMHGLQQHAEREVGWLPGAVLLHCRHTYLYRDFFFNIRYFFFNLLATEELNALYNGC